MTPETSAAGDEVYGKPFHGWSCDCDECRSYDERGEPRPGEAPKVSAASEACPCGCRRTVKPCSTKVAHDDHCWPLVGGVMSLYWCPGVSRRKAVTSA